ncbi:hypothetical protein GBF38_012092 [Nibea albiflora]|uniref:Uncharacterized protein n=1 Tax=Nibea albiflora TaxID=240163 RepID=A0ACB7EI10_NIBAL|nr:hypothetical protein GBF38_012092 [Nibea albiflora]
MRAIRLAPSFSQMSSDPVNQSQTAQPGDSHSGIEVEKCFCVTPAEGSGFMEGVELTDEQSSSVHSVPHRRVPRLRRDMSPSSMKKETERIAKIFAAHFDDSQ